MFVWPGTQQTFVSPCAAMSAWNSSKTAGDESDGVPLRQFAAARLSRHTTIGLWVIACAQSSSQTLQSTLSFGVEDFSRLEPAAAIHDRRVVSVDGVAVSRRAFCRHGTPTTFDNETFGQGPGASINLNMRESPVEDSFGR